MKRIFPVSIAIILIISLFMITANATAKYVKDSGGGDIQASAGGHITISTTGPDSANVSYGTSWELYVYYDTTNTIIRFGFNTFATNEDFVYAYQKQFPHQATVKNNTHPVQTSAQKPANKWTSKVDVPHGSCPIWKILY